MSLSSRFWTSSFKNYWSRESKNYSELFQGGYNGRKILEKVSREICFHDADRDLYPDQAHRLGRLWHSCHTSRTTNYDGTWPGWRLEHNHDCFSIVVLLSFLRRQTVKEYPRSTTAARNRIPRGATFFMVCSTWDFRQLDPGRMNWSRMVSARIQNVKTYPIDAGGRSVRRAPLNAIPRKSASINTESTTNIHSKFFVPGSIALARAATTTITAVPKSHRCTTRMWRRALFHEPDDCRCNWDQTRSTHLTPFPNWVPYLKIGRHVTQTELIQVQQWGYCTPSGRNWQPLLFIHESRSNVGHEMSYGRRNQHLLWRCALHPCHGGHRRCSPRDRRWIHVS